MTPGLFIARLRTFMSVNSMLDSEVGFLFDVPQRTVMRWRKGKALPKKDKMRECWALMDGYKEPMVRTVSSSSTLRVSVGERVDAE